MNHARLAEIVKEYTENTPWRNKDPHTMTIREMTTLFNEVLDYGIRMGYLKEIEKTDKGCIFKIVGE